MHINKTIALIILLKLVVATVFLYMLTVVKGMHMVNAMADQQFYLSDIQYILEDISFLFASDEEYFSNNTLYSRLVGLFAVFIPYSSSEPIIPVVFLNTLFQIFTAGLVSKYYQRMGGVYSTWLFAFIAFSPSITAYTFFALRDTLITFFFTAFVIAVVNLRYLHATLATIGLVALRPLYLAYALYILFLGFLLNLYNRVKQKIVFLIVFIPCISILAHGVIVITEFEWIYNIFKRDSFTLLNYVTTSLGYGIFLSSGNENALVSIASSRNIRYLMVDSLIIPLIAVGCSVYVIKKGQGELKKLGFFILFLIFSLSFVYLAIQGNYPMRKILPMFPIMYLVIFFSVDLYRQIKMHEKRIKRARQKIFSR